MPPRSSLTSSFSVTDANNEVICPLKNNDGSSCRKRCTGEKRFRSMQEHIRRAHPNHYIPKLPATEESFLLMVTTPPDQRAHLSPPEPARPRRPHGHDIADRDIYVADASSPATPRALDEPHPAAATAAVALAQLHHHRLASDWDTDMDTHSDTDIHQGRMRSSIELPSLRDHFKQESLPPFSSPRPRELLPSILNHSPPGRSSTLPPIQRRDKPSRPRKSSITQSARKPKHDRPRSKEFGRRPSLGDRKALSAEPQTAAWAQGKRWEDLIEAATSATEADDERYSEAGQSPTIAPLLANVTSAPSGFKNRSSLPPAFQSGSGLPPLSSHRQFPPHSYAASPLHKSLTPPPFEGHRGRDNDLEPFPSIESSLDSMSSASGKNFPSSTSGIARSINSDSSPVLNLIPPLSQNRQHHRFSNPTPASFRNNDIQIYCAHCRRPWPLNECYACTECICGVCRECVPMFISSPPASFRTPGNGSLNSAPPPGPTSYPSVRGCPRCRSTGGKWKAFQIDVK
ncbi:Putative RfeD [Penicillium brasilianum]|uniref:Putative RfeD n=1 Tax=Penicillium brasilianum TaxID=104259 RepID=A0A0F7U2B0_PENBI|nr:Putative RfeD [Penicillium brasilianum]